MIKDKSMDHKLIFLDIDGTLLPPGDMLIPESTLAALDRARANGHKLLFVHRPQPPHDRTAAAARLLCGRSVQRRRLCAVRWQDSGGYPHGAAAG